MIYRTTLCLALVAALGGGVAELGLRHRTRIRHMLGLLPAPTAQSLFEAARVEFTKTTPPSTGLGPAFNGNSCESCHHIPETGGTGLQLVMRVGRVDADGTFHAPAGGSFLPLLSIADHRCQAQMPADVNVIGRRIPTPVFGAGLVEAIPDETLVALEDPDDRDGDGVSGRAARVVDITSGESRIGRFGWKAGHPTVLAFTADAYAHEIGVTNRFFPKDGALGITPEQMVECDQAPDPEDVPNAETGRTALDNFTFFIQMLPARPRGTVAEAERRGERLFSSIGCSTCHVPRLMTGSSPHPSLAGQSVDAFSDFLLHDIGTGDGIAQDAALPTEFRTAPLWGLRHRPLLLHDGSAGNIETAVGRHRNEADGARARFTELSPDARAALLAFLRSL